MAKKKLVSFSMLALALGELTFSLWHPHHEIGAIEAIEGFITFLAGVVLYATDVHKIVVSISRSLYENVELKVLDAFNYCVANLTIAFCQRFRKTHTGVLSYNMLAVIIGIILLLILLFLFGGYIP